MCLKDISSPRALSKNQQLQSHEKNIRYWETFCRYLASTSRDGQGYEKEEKTEKLSKTRGIRGKWVNQMQCGSGGSFLGWKEAQDKGKKSEESLELWLVNNNISLLVSWFWQMQMLMTGGGSGVRVFRDTLYYLCKFSLNLKWLQNKTLVVKTNKQTNNN